MAEVIKRAGRYDISADAYHADPVQAISLSRSTAVTLLERSPRHAWHGHPRLNPDYQPTEAKRFDLGTVFHDLILTQPNRLMIIKADSYAGLASRQKRDTARRMGLVPVLAPDLDRAKGMVAAARSQLANHPEANEAFLEGESEVTLVWTEQVLLEDGTRFKIWCRCRLDWLTPGSPVFWDAKSTQTPAHPSAWGNLLFREGLDVQAAFYRRGIWKVLKIPRDTIEFRFVVVEVDPPYALSVVALGPTAMDYADRKVEAAMRLWGACMRAGEWPGYPARIAYAEPPVWQERAWLDREDREQADRAAGLDQLQAAIRWQAPLNPRGKTK